MDEDTKRMLIFLLLIVANTAAFFKGLKLEEQVDLLNIEVAEKKKRIVQPRGRFGMRANKFFTVFACCILAICALGTLSLLKHMIEIWWLR